MRNRILPILGIVVVMCLPACALLGDMTPEQKGAMIDTGTDLATGILSGVPGGAIACELISVVAVFFTGKKSIKALVRKLLNSEKGKIFGQGKEG